MLYHYTSFEAVKGIVSERVWRASDVRLLNDRSEYLYAFDVAALTARNFATAQDSLRHRVGSDFGADLLENWHLNNRVYVISLSAVGDLLSQWRGYCSGGGVAIGLNEQELRRQVSTQAGWAIRQCEYPDEASFSARLETELEAEVGRVTRADAASGALRPSIPTTVNARRWLWDQAPFAKHPSFREEAEWRIVYVGKPAKLYFHSRAAYLKPFCHFPIAPSAIVELTVAPHPESGMAMEALRDFVRADPALHHITIAASKATWRGVELDDYNRLS